MAAQFNAQTARENARKKLNVAAHTAAILNRAEEASNNGALSISLVAADFGLPSKDEKGNATELNHENVVTLVVQELRAQGFVVEFLNRHFIYLNW